LTTKVTERLFCHIPPHLNHPGPYNVFWFIAYYCNPLEELLAIYLKNNHKITVCSSDTAVLWQWTCGNFPL